MPGYRIFEVYFARETGKVGTGEEAITDVRSQDTMGTLRVRAQLARKTEDLPGSEELWVTDDVGTILPDNPWAIKILEELDAAKTPFDSVPGGTKPIYAK